MQATLSDTNYEESASTASKDAKYNPNDMLAFVASLKPMNDTGCDSEDDEFTNEQRVEFFLILLLRMKDYLRVI